MKATIEWLEKGRIGIVRAGPHCGRFTKPYDYAAVFVRPKYGPGAVKLKALVADGRFKTSHRRAIVGKLLNYFSRVTWDRCKPWGILKRN